MDTKTPTLTSFGTPKQFGLLKHLAKEHRFATIDAALEAVGMAAPLTVDTASKAIDQLKALAAQASATAGSGGRPSDLSAHELRRIDAGELAAPSELTAHAAYVLQRLSKLREIELVVGSPARWEGINQGGPIAITHLVNYFGGLEQVALAFAVAVDTVRGWGTTLPSSRCYEAQVKTKGYVCAP